MVCAIWTRFLCHFQNGASLFCTSKTGVVMKQNVNFYPFYTVFAKMALVTIYMVQSQKTGSHFFHKELNYLLKQFLEPTTVIRATKNAEMCQILGIFSVYYCNSLSNTFSIWATPKHHPRDLKFESCGYLIQNFHLEGEEKFQQKFWHISLCLWATLLYYE